MPCLPLYFRKGVLMFGVHIKHQNAEKMWSQWPGCWFQTGWFDDFRISCILTCLKFTNNVEKHSSQLWWEEKRLKKRKRSWTSRRMSYERKIPHRLPLVSAANRNLGLQWAENLASAEWIHHRNLPGGGGVMLWGIVLFGDVLGTLILIQHCLNATAYLSIAGSW